MSKKKFKIGDVVFYRDIPDDPNDVGGIGIVVSLKTAKKLYKEQNGYDTTVSILKESKHKKPVFMVNPRYNNSIGWMPYEDLYLMSAAMQILYGLKPE